MNLTELTRLVLGGKQLNEEQSALAARLILSEQATPIQVAAFLTALQGRGETASELVGFAKTLRELAEPFEAPEGVILDTCGTGGDHSGTFNISTAVAFVVAGAGVRVAKHGNRSVTSHCGSADVLEALGVRIDAQRAVMERALREIGICFLFAPAYHKAMRAVATVRRELGFRTIFNMLGPLVNPARATHQLVGVFNETCAELYLEAMAKLGIQRAMIVHSEDGLDEISLSSATTLWEFSPAGTAQRKIVPEDFGFRRTSSDEFRGGTAQENAQIIESILGGQQGPRTDVVVLNAGAALFVSQAARTIAEGIELARESLKSGRAAEKLEKLKLMTNTQGECRK